MELDDFSLLSPFSVISHRPLVGFVGQGFVGKNYADDFERRGFPVVRYSLEPAYARNKDRIRECDVVFIAVPTPTLPEGFDASLVHEAISLVSKGKIAVIKSTLLPGTTDALQDSYSDRIVIHSPEFLSEKTAAHDAAYPPRNIAGIPRDTPEHRQAGTFVLSLLPSAPYTLLCSAREAEVIKYAHNTAGYVRVVFSNILYDVARKAGADWERIESAIAADPQDGPVYTKPIHKTGRGAGGHCFIKDFAALRMFFEDTLEESIQDDMSLAVLNALEQKNIALLAESKKDLDLLAGVYGEEIAGGPFSSALIRSPYQEAGEQ